MVWLFFFPIECNYDYVDRDIHINCGNDSGHFPTTVTLTAPLQLLLQETVVLVRKVLLQHIPIWHPKPAKHVLKEVL